MTEKLAAGAAVEPRQLVTITGEPLTLPHGSGLTHVQFRRFAGCPVCNLHLQSVVRRHDQIMAAGVREIVVFHSTAEELREHAAGLPFAVVADPGKRLYREFGVESGPRALLDPRVWVPLVRSVLRSAWAIVRGRGRPPALRQPGGRLGLPADILLDGTGRVLASSYGRHAYDQWSVDELLDHVRAVAVRSVQSS